MSFISVLKSIGHKAETVFEDIEKGFALAQPFLQFIPGGALAGQVFVRVEAIVNNLHAATGGQLTTDQVSAITQAIAYLESLKQVQVSPPGGGTTASATVTVAK